MVDARSIGIEQQEILCGEDLQKRVETTVTQAKSHVGPRDNPGIIIRINLVKTRFVRLVCDDEAQRHRRLPADQQTEGQEHSAAPKRYRRNILRLWAAKGASGGRQSWHSSIVLRHCLYRVYTGTAPHRQIHDGGCGVL